MMPRYSNTQVKESIEELEKLHHSHQGEKFRKRIKMLMHLKAKSFKTRQELADELRIGKRTLETWVSTYEKQGIKLLLTPITRNRDSKFIHGEIKEDLFNKLNDPKTAFSSYVEIQTWLKTEHNCDIEYANLYYYLRLHFKTKLKVPRKSNINKDEQEVALFKNARA